MVRTPVTTVARASQFSELLLPPPQSPTRVATSQGNRRPRKESLMYPEGSPHRIHAMHKQDNVLELIQGWSSRVGDLCPYIAPSAVQGVVRHSHGSPKQRRPLRHSATTTQCTATKLPSPKRPAWDTSTQPTTSAETACNLHIILHNHKLALVHRTSHLSTPPTYLSKLQGTAPVYGLAMLSPADEARRAAPVDFAKSATWTLKVHPLHAINLVDPCRMRKAHVCSRLLRPFVEVVCPDGGGAAKRCKPSVSSGPAPIWSNGWLVVPLSIPPSTSSCPTEFQVCVLNKCCDNDIVVGTTSVSFGNADGNHQGCAFYTLRNRRGKPTGQIKLMFVLQPADTSPPVLPQCQQLEAALSPRAKFLFGDELRMKKSNLKHVETSHVVVVKAPIQRSIEETQAMLSRIEASVRGSTTGVQLWPERDFGGEVPVGEGIHACVKQVQMNGTMLAVKEYRYQTAQVVPPHGVVRAFQHEVDMLLAIHHDNIVGLVGVVLHPRLALVTEYMDCGSVYLCRHNPRLWTSITLEQKGYIALQIACAISYLHQASVIHRDIKSHNILLSGLSNSTMPTAKLCDLGSAFVYTNTKPTEEVGTSGYIAPEVASGHEYSFPSDIWSFGIFLWEVLTPSTCSNPFVGQTNDTFVDQVTSGIRPSLAFAGVYAPILDECWRLIPSERPSADTLVAQLTALLQ
ncbi:TKL protein kinase [Aphanomyces astaci]|uniref:TKL protein kinase n=1 Tax=Aphanomyces astaci TaxID=112090 RepID=W4HE33_APHAT|nr:TKL protein kinase [Aphanomyces astaci]ETV89418.1 TKL protein kinase [Aphanomyces astaci]|eukprot:XP_009821818.1 TKL protein kinase [Aphanomyces astaci]